MRTSRAAFICGALAASFAGFLLSMGAFAPWTRLVFGPVETGAAPLLWAQWAGALVLGFGLAWTTVLIRSLPLKAVVTAVALVETAVLSWTLHLRGIFWPPFTALASGVLATCLGFVYSLSAPGQRRRALETVLGGRITKGTFRQWLDSNEPLPFDGQRRESSVVVCRVFNRQRFAETLSAPDDVVFYREFLKAASQALMDAGGVLTEGGEYLCAAYGAVLSEPTHAVKACGAALALRDRLDLFNQECQERWSMALEYGIGVHSGMLNVGAAASGALGGFSVTGETLEFARRLSHANRGYGSRILVSPQTFGLSREALEVRPAELIWNLRVQTREEIYELLALHNGLSPEARQRRDVFWKGVVLWRQKQWGEAAAQFETVLRESEDKDALARFYLARTAHPGSPEPRLIADRI